MNLMSYVDLSEPTLSPTRLSLSEKTIKCQVDSQSGRSLTRFTITNHSEMAVEYTRQSNASWVQANKYVGRLRAGDEIEVLVSFQAPFPNSGRYEAMITVSDRWTDQAIMLVAEVTDRNEFQPEWEQEFVRLTYHDFLLPG